MSGTPRDGAERPRQAAWRAALTSCALTLLALWIARRGWGMPDRLLLILGALLLACWSAVYWGSVVYSPRPSGRHVSYVALAWLAAAAALLGPLFVLDRGGWLWRQVTHRPVAFAEDHAAAVALTPADFVALHPEFALDPADPGRVTLPRGTHDFAASVVVPRGVRLVIEPGAVLRFAARRSLVSYGPVEARGRADAPIRMQARWRPFKWGAVGLVDAGPSAFEYVQIEDASEAVVNGIEFPAALSTVRTDLVLRDSRITGAFGADAVNVRGRRVEIHGNSIGPGCIDGLDLIDAEGEVSGNLIVDCADEGIDLVRNQGLRVHGNTIAAAGGGRLAADFGLDELRRSNTLRRMPGPP